MSCNDKSNSRGSADEIDVFINIEHIGELPKENPIRVFQELCKEFVLIQKLERDPKKDPLSLEQLEDIKKQIDKNREQLSLKLNSEFNLSLFSEIVCIMRKMLELEKKLL